MSSSGEAEAVSLLTRFLSPHTSAIERTIHEASLVAIRDGLGAWRWGLELLASPAGAVDARAGGAGCGAALQWLAAAAVESAVLRRWTHFAAEDKNAIFSAIFSCLIPPALKPGLSSMAATKLSKALVCSLPASYPKPSP
jgi:hypothetical protein